MARYIPGIYTRYISYHFYSPYQVVSHQIAGTEYIAKTAQMTAFVDVHCTPVSVRVRYCSNYKSIVSLSLTMPLNFLSPHCPTFRIIAGASFSITPSLLTCYSNT